MRQLSTGKGIDELKVYYDRVEEIKKKYSGTITFEYVPKNDPAYLRVDKLAKWANEHIPRQYIKAGRADSTKEQ